MVFQRDGSSHFSGIKNEKDIINYMNNNNNEITKIFNNSKWIHMGGTKNKADAIVNQNNKDIEISIKNHKTTGTYDFINTSHFPKKKSININIEKFK